MIKVTVTTEEVKHTKRFCDFCSNEINTRYSSSQCKNCKKDICSKCIEHEDDFCGDRPDAWCKKCWDIGNEYRLKIKELESQIEKLQEEWESKCKT